MVEIPRLHFTETGNLATDEHFPGLYHEGHRALFFNRAPYAATALVCHTTNHLVSVILRGTAFLVDEDSPVRRLKAPEVKTLFAQTTFTFLAKLPSTRRSQREQPPAATPSSM